MGFGMRWHQLDHMQTICTLLQADNLNNISSFIFYKPDVLPDARPTVSKYWRQRALKAKSTEGKHKHRHTINTNAINRNVARVENLHCVLKAKGVCQYFGLRQILSGDIYIMKECCYQNAVVTVAKRQTTNSYKQTSKSMLA